MVAKALGKPQRFRRESDMAAAARTLAVEMVRNRRETWALLPEHQVYARIPDLVLAKVNVRALTARKMQRRLHPLVEADLRVLRELRSDRGATIKHVAGATGLSYRHTERVLRRLRRYGYVSRDRPRTHRRTATPEPVFDRITTFEFKRGDSRRALIQARAHQPFADNVFVIYDRAYSSRYRAQVADFRRLGIGLIELSSSGGHKRTAQSHRSALRNRLSVSISAERMLARFLGAKITTLPESRLPNASAANGDQVRPLLVGPHAKTVSRLLAAERRRVSSERRRRRSRRPPVEHTNTRSA